MACFLVPTTEAIVTTVVSHVLESKEKKNTVTETAITDTASTDAATEDTGMKKPFYKKINWLSNLLWGGSAMLAFEHVWHGEVAPWFPFLTAARNSEAAAQMLHEMSTVGVSMAVLVTAVWAGMVAVSNIMEKEQMNRKQMLFQNNKKRELS